jgi:hypothetical protein
MNYWIKSDNESYGPFSTEEVKHLLKVKAINAGNWLHREDGKKLHADEVAELRSAMPQRNPLVYWSAWGVGVCALSWVAINISPLAALFALVIGVFSAKSLLHCDVHQVAMIRERKVARQESGKAPTEPEAGFSWGAVLLVVGLLIGGFFVMFYDVGIEGIVNVERTNHRTVGTIGGVGLALLGGVLMVVEKLGTKQRP